MNDQPEPEDTCRPVDIDGETIRVRGSEDLTEEGQEALAALVRVAKAKFVADAPEKVGELQGKLRLAHKARRNKEHQLDDIRRALCDIGFMQDDDPYSHADLADVIRQNGPAATEATQTETTERLRAAEFTALHWHQALLDHGRDHVFGVHAIACILAALQGQTRPDELGLEDEAHDAFRAALAGLAATAQRAGDSKRDDFALTDEQPRTTPNNPPTSGDAANNPLREQYAAIIRSECGSRFEYVTAQLLAVHQRDTAQLRRERDMALKAAREARGGVAHDAGPSVAECRDHDRAWDVEQEAP